MSVKIDVRGLSMTFNSKGSPAIQALGPLDLAVEDGEFLCIVGPSGCGKTTLLRILGGLEREFSGDVRIYDADGKTPLTALVFQEQSVFPWMTVEGNVAYGLRMLKTDRATVKERVGRYLDLMGLSEFSTAYPHQLSGGMKQRVSVARAFAVDPQVLLMDEPFGALDEQTRLVLQQELLRIWEGTKKTAVFITHSIDEAIALGDRVIIMTPRPGRIGEIQEIRIPRPRLIGEIRDAEGFNGYYHRISSLIRNPSPEPTV